MSALWNTRTPLLSPQRPAPTRPSQKDAGLAKGLGHAAPNGREA